MENIDNISACTLSSSRQVAHTTIVGNPFLFLFLFFIFLYVFILDLRAEHPVTLSDGRIRSSWFNIRRLPPCPNDYDETTMLESITRIEGLVTQEIQNGIPPSHVVLVGFGQGGALALVTALTSLHDIGGVAALSAWLPQRAREVGVMIIMLLHVLFILIYI
jgi:pimeloyl-ACP methyl ester carboxylesterase